MSDNLDIPEIAKFEYKLQTGSQSPHLSKTFAELCLTLHISSLFLKEVKNSKSNFPNFSYVDIINSQIHAYQLIHSDRIEKRFFVLCKKVDLALRTKYRSGRKREQ